jgi:hypothetical protein
VISYDVGFNPSTQRHYRRLIYEYYLYIHVSAVRPSSSFGLFTHWGILYKPITTATALTTSALKGSEGVQHVGITELLVSVHRPLYKSKCFAKLSATRPADGSGARLQAGRSRHSKSKSLYG